MNDTATLAASAPSSASAVRADSSTLIVRHLKKRYGSRTVVKDVSLDVKSGEVVGLLGPNGAGKTTSFYMIVGLVALDEGDIVLDDEHISGLAIHERARMGLSYLPQEASVFRKLNVEENIRAVLELQRENGKPLSKAEIDRRLDSLLDDLQIAHLRNNPALSLSGANAAAWKSRVRWPPRRASSCSTSRLPAWTRSPWAKSSASSVSSRHAISAC